MATLILAKLGFKSSQNKNKAEKDGVRLLRPVPVPIATWAKDQLNLHMSMLSMDFEYAAIVLRLFALHKPILVKKP